MRVGIFAKTFAGDTPDAVLAAAARSGFSAVQYNMACSGLGALPPDVPEGAARAVREAAAAQGVMIAAVSATYNMIDPDLRRREAGRRAFAAIAARAAAMGTRILTVCTGSRDAADQWRHHPENRSAAAWAEMMAEFVQLIAIAEAHDILIGVEPELANVVDGAESARRLIREAGSDRIRIVLDPANLAEAVPADDRRRIIAAAVDLLAGEIVMAHAKDRDAAGGFATAGKGVIDFRHFIACLRGVGFDGALVAHGLEAGEASAVAAHLAALVGEGGGR